MWRKASLFFLVFTFLMSIGGAVKATNTYTSLQETYAVSKNYTDINLKEEFDEHQQEVEMFGSKLEIVNEKVDTVITTLKNLENSFIYYPYPAKPDFEVLELESVFDAVTIWENEYNMNILWMGANSDSTLLLARGVTLAGNQIFYSSDGGENWNRICSGGYFNSPQWALAIPNKSIVVCDRKPGDIYEIHYSENFKNDSHTNWNLKVTADAGVFSYRYGLSNRGNVIAVTTYGLMSAKNPPRFLYLSRDAGKSWATIEVERIEDMVSPGDYHIHDVEYDPWANRIWLSNGDRDNSCLQYSDDWGRT